ncbi:hypothetical protein LTR73_008624, partial [Friedmanniomyces endolithicus]
MRPRPSSGGYAKHILLVNWSNRTKLRGDHCKLEKDEDTEMLNPGDSEMHDSVTGPIRSQHHDSSGGKAHGADYLLENVKNPLRQPP